MKDKKKDEKEFEESWSLKRVGIALVLLLCLIGGLTYLFKVNFFSGGDEISEKQSVLSATDENLEEAISNQIEAVKYQAENLDIEEIASSSPQIKNLINDLKSLQNYPKNQAKEACFRICKNF